MGVVTLAEHVPGKLGSLDAIETIEAKKLAGFFQHLFDHGRCLRQKGAGRGSPWILVSTLGIFVSATVRPGPETVAKEMVKMVSVIIPPGLLRRRWRCLTQARVGLESRLDSRSR